MRAAGEKITMLTCYDASFAALMDRCGVEVLLVGDSLGMVCQGHNSTLPVTIADIAYHTASVARGNQTALLIADMPWVPLYFGQQHYVIKQNVKNWKPGAIVVPFLRFVQVDAK